MIVRSLIGFVGLGLLLFAARFAVEQQRHPLRRLKMGFVNMTLNVRHGRAFFQRSFVKRSGDCEKSEGGFEPQTGYATMPGEFTVSQPFEQRGTLLRLACFLCFGGVLDRSPFSRDDMRKERDCEMGERGIDSQSVATPAAERISASSMGDPVELGAEPQLSRPLASGPSLHLAPPRSPGDQKELYTAVLSQAVDVKETSREDMIDWAAVRSFVTAARCKGELRIILDLPDGFRKASPTHVTQPTHSSHLSALGVPYSGVGHVETDRGDEDLMWEHIKRNVRVLSSNAF